MLVGVELKIHGIKLKMFSFYIRNFSKPASTHHIKIRTMTGANHRIALVEGISCEAICLFSHQNSITNQGGISPELLWRQLLLIGYRNSRDTLRKLFFHFLSQWMGYDRGDSFIFNFKPNGIHLVQNRKENCHHNYIPFIVKGNGKIVFSVYMYVSKLSSTMRNNYFLGNTSSIQPIYCLQVCNEFGLFPN